MMSAPSTFARDLVRVIWPILALGLFATLFAPARADEPHAAVPREIASIRCDAPMELVAWGPRSAPARPQRGSGNP